MLKDHIKKDLNVFLKEKRALESSALRLLLSVLQSKEKEKRFALFQKQTDNLDKESELTDKEVIKIVSSEIKKREEAAKQYDLGQRPELSEKERKEAEVLKKYLPQSLSEEEVMVIIKEVIAQANTKEPGRIMKEVLPKVEGRIDSAKVFELIKSLL